MRERVKIVAKKALIMSTGFAIFHSVLSAFDAIPTIFFFNLRSYLKMQTFQNKKEEKIKKSF
jgi:hypothetical protein